ncbi:MAG: FAD:protein FMN transferase [Clostridia bacterium]|nr:FAD:protein FMN transferase [Clostridia bacterium]
MKKLLSFVICIVLAFVVAFGGGNDVCAVQERVDKALYNFNTESIVSLVGVNANDAFDEIEKEFNKIDKTFSLNENSQIKKLNEQGYLLDAGDEVVGLLQKAKEIYALTNGAFNPATYLLTDLWQLSSRFSDNSDDFEPRPYDRPLYTLPDDKYITAFKQLLNFEDIVIDGNDVYLPDNKVTVDGVDYSMQIDLGGIVKGYAAQRAREIAKSFGITNGYVSLGGSSIVFFNNANSKDGKYAVGILDPDNATGYYAKTNVQNVSMSTSGDYQPGKYFQLDGKKYCHIIDGKTGAPVDTGIRTVSILCNDPVLADALTTAVMVKGFDDAKTFVASDYFKTNDIKTAFVFEKDWLFGSRYEMICNVEKGFFNVTSNNVTVCGYMSDGKLVYHPTQANLWLAITVVAIVAIAFVVVAVKKAQSYQKPNFKKQKFFKKADVVLYALVGVAVVSLFLSFVVLRPKLDLKFINVYHQNNLVYQYDVEKGVGGIVDDNYKQHVTTEKQGEKITVTIEYNGHKNVVQIEKNSAKMIEANCSNTKECVNSFAPITNGNQTIICDVSHVKIVGVASGESLIING